MLSRSLKLTAPIRMLRKIREPPRNSAPRCNDAKVIVIKLLDEERADRTLLEVVTSLSRASDRQRHAEALRVRPACPTTKTRSLR
jgi:hypothetical protein